MRKGYETKGVYDLLGKLDLIINTCEKYGFNRVDGNMQVLKIYNSENSLIKVTTQLSGFISICYVKEEYKEELFLTCNVSELETYLQNLPIK
jgi:hypothetical protein